MLICVVGCLAGLKFSSGPLGLMPLVEDGRKERLGGWSVCWIREGWLFEVDRMDVVVTGGYREWELWLMGGTVKGRDGEGGTQSLGTIFL